MKLLTHDKEEWRDIKGYEDLYQVSNMGNIKRLKCGISGKLISHRGVTRYAMVTLSKNGVVSNLLVHRLVAIMFIPNQNNKPCVNHKDGMKRNNCVDNLEWCTYSENKAHSIAVLNNKPKLQNLPTYENSWETPIVVNGVNIMGTKRKKMYKMLLSVGATRGDIKKSGMSIYSFENLIMYLKKAKVPIVTKAAKPPYRFRYFIKP